MCVDSLYKTNTKDNFRYVFVAPYENQIRLIFTRINELIDESELVKARVVRRTRNPYVIEFDNHSMIQGYTTGAGSGNGAASIRGIRADALALDECDYMNTADFDAVLMIAGERQGISVFISSTPTGKRSKFWECCTNPDLGFKEFHFPSMCNPNWGPEMEREFRAQLTELGYIHEVLAEFGPQDTGVFNKDDIDKAMTFDMYTYDELDYIQQERVKQENLEVKSYIPDGNGVFRYNKFRTMGIDWDKYSASSSIVILDFDVTRNKYRVIKRVEVPKSEYSYDNAVNLVVKLNDIYQPSWIFADRGAGEYQIERLHIIGDTRPETGLKNKVIGWQFKNVIEIEDPVTHEINKEPMKPFMVNQLIMAFERKKIILSPFDNVLHDQLINYEIERIGSNGQPVFSSKNEHFIDALGLALLAFVLKFPNIAQTVKEIDRSTIIKSTNINIAKDTVFKALKQIGQSFMNRRTKLWEQQNDPTELPGDKPKYIKVEPGPLRNTMTMTSWGSRMSFNKNPGRRFW